MIFCTLSVGEEWCKKYSNKIDDIGKLHEVYVYTDFGEYFPNCNIIKYTRNDFSYFEKLVLLFEVMSKHKKRVTYFDCDSTEEPKLQMILNNLHNPFDKESIYTYIIFPNEEFTHLLIARNPSFVVLMEVHKQLGFENFVCDYTHERILSIPYISNKFKILKENVLSVQSIWETNWPKGKKWVGWSEFYQGTHDCNKWSQIGCGYSEGGALSLYAKKLEIKLKEISPRTTLI